MNVLRPLALPLILTSTTSTAHTKPSPAQLHHSLHGPFDHPLCNGFVTTAAHVRSTVGEQPVDDDATNGEQEDQEGPKQLVRDRTIRLQDFDCKGIVISSDTDEEHINREGIVRRRRTDHDDVKNQDDESDDAAARAILPVASSCGGRADWLGHG